MTEKEELMRSLEKTSIATYVVLSLFFSLIVVYLSTSSLVTALIISSIVSFTILYFFRRKQSNRKV
jgi:multisubunit Na+/H+ antiporter MnhE subunit